MAHELIDPFWNPSMYDNNALFTENARKRYCIWGTTDGLKAGADGSIDIYIYIQPDDPGAESIGCPPRLMISS